MPLKPRHRRFVEEYLIDLNGTQAAIRAGYSPKGADVTAVRLLANARIAAEVAKAQALRSRRTGISQDRVVRELARIAMGDLRRLVRWGEGGVHLVPSAELADDDVAMIAEVSATEHGLRVKAHSKIEALKLLGQHLGMFKLVNEHTGKDGGPIETAARIDLSGLTPDERDVLRAILGRRAAPPAPGAD